MQRKILILFVVVILCIIKMLATGAQSVTLAWNANTETNLAGYRLYYGTNSRDYIGWNQTSNITSTVTNLNSGRTYYFAVTAYTDDGLESAYSDEVSYLVPTPGPPPRTITITLEEACDLLGPWDKTTNVVSIVVPQGVSFYRAVVEIK